MALENPYRLDDRFHRWRLRHIVDQFHTLHDELLPGQARRIHVRRGIGLALRFGWGWRMEDPLRQVFPNDERFIGTDLDALTAIEFIGWIGQAVALALVGHQPGVAALYG